MTKYVLIITIWGIIYVLHFKCSFRFEQDIGINNYVNDDNKTKNRFKKMKIHGQNNSKRSLSDIALSKKTNSLLQNQSASTLISK